MSITSPETISRPSSLLQQGDRGARQPANSNVNAVRDGEAPVRRGVFGTFMDALHDSRRQQAMYAIHRYRRLIAAPRSLNAGVATTAGTIFDQPKSRINMTTSDDAGISQLNRPTKARTTNGLTWLLLAICVIGFGILHVAGGAIINGAVKPTAEMPPVQLNGD